MSRESTTPIRIQRFAEAPGSPDGQLTLTFDKRQKSRFRATLDDGRPVAVDLPRGRALRGGDQLLGDGELRVSIVGALESLTEATADDALLFARGCYHMGNRHVPLQIEPGRMRFQPDHVLEAMLVSLGLEITPVEAAFDPEPGAYEGKGASHGHEHADQHAHGHTHSHPHDHTHGGNAEDDKPQGGARIHLMDGSELVKGGVGGR